MKIPQVQTMIKKAEDSKLNPPEDLYTMKRAKGGLVLWQVEKITIKDDQVIQRQMISERDAWDYALGRLIGYLEKDNFK